MLNEVIVEEVKADSGQMNDLVAERPRDGTVKKPREWQSGQMSTWPGVEESSIQLDRPVSGRRAPRLQQPPSAASEKGFRERKQNLGARAPTFLSEGTWRRKVDEESE